MNKYTVYVHKALTGDVIPLYSVALAMSKHAASGYGDLTLHEPTLRNIISRYNALLLDAACKGFLKVCDRDGRIGAANEIIEAAQKEGVTSTSIPPLHARLKHLIEWGQANGDDFNIVYAPVEVVELANGDRGIVGLPYQTDAPITAAPCEATTTPIVDGGNAAKKPGPKPGQHRERMNKILNALEDWAAAGSLTFDREAMPGKVGKGSEDEGGFHWFCAQLHRDFRKGSRAFENHRANLCKFPPGAKGSDFYRNALPTITGKLKADKEFSAPTQKRRKPA